MKSFWTATLLLCTVGTMTDSAQPSSRAIAWRTKCPNPQSPCCRAWHKLIHTSEEAMNGFLSSTLDPRFSPLDAFDRYEPDWNCETRERIPRVGGDGPKWICGVGILPQNSLVYSFGSSGDTQFEEAVRAALPQSNIYIFDPTLQPEVAKSVRDKKFMLLESGLAGRNVASFNHSKKNFPGKSLIQHTADLQHKGEVIDVLKMDIDNGEFAAFDDIIVGDCDNAEVRVGQILIEMHFHPGKSNSAAAKEKISKLMAGFAGCNMKMFSKERNHWGCAGFKCVEFSFIGPSQAFETFKSTHPSCSQISS